MNVSARDSEIIARYTGESETTITDLARLYSMSTRQVENILNNNGINRIPKVKTKKSFSDLHRSVGETLFYYRNMTGLTFKEVSKSVDMSVNRLVAIEKGIYDVSITDLKKLADYFNIKLTEIIANYENKLDKQ